MFVMPKVGDKVTVNYYSELQPAQVVKVAKSGKTMWIRENVTTQASNERECNKWSIHENEFEGDAYKVTLRGDGAWRVTGDNCRCYLNEWRKNVDYGC